MWQQTPQPRRGIQPPRMPFPLRPCSETAGTESLASSHQPGIKIGLTRTQPLSKEN